MEAEKISSGIVLAVIPSRGEGKECAEWVKAFPGFKSIVLPKSGVGVRAVYVVLDLARRIVLPVEGAGFVDKNSTNLGVLGWMGNGPFLEILLVCRRAGWNDCGVSSAVGLLGFEVFCWATANVDTRLIS